MGAVVSMGCRVSNPTTARAAGAETGGRVPKPTRVTLALVPESTRVAMPAAVGVTSPRTAEVVG